MQSRKMDCSQFDNVMVVILYVAIKTKMGLSFFTNDSVPSLGIRDVSSFLMDPCKVPMSNDSCNNCLKSPPILSHIS